MDRVLRGILRPQDGGETPCYQDERINYKIGRACSGNGRYETHTKMWSEIRVEQRRLKDDNNYSSSCCIIVLMKETVRPLKHLSNSTSNILAKMKYNIKKYLVKKTESEDLEWIHVAHDRNQCRTVGNTITIGQWFIDGDEFLDYPGDNLYLKNRCHVIPSSYTCRLTGPHPKQSIDQPIRKHETHSSSPSTQIKQDARPTDDIGSAKNMYTQFWRM